LRDGESLVNPAGDLFLTGTPTFRILHFLFTYTKITRRNTANAETAARNAVASTGTK